MEKLSEEEKKRRKLAYNKRYRIENADKIRDKRKLYRIENADKIRESKKHWALANPDCQKKANKKRIELLKDGYIVNRISKTFSVNPNIIRNNPELIEAYRGQIKIKRLLTQKKKQTN